MTPQVCIDLPEYCSNAQTHATPLAVHGNDPEFPFLLGVPLWSVDLAEDTTTRRSWLCPYWSHGISSVDANTTADFDSLSLEFG